MAEEVVVQNFGEYQEISEAEILQRLSKQQEAVVEEPKVEPQQEETKVEPAATPAQVVYEEKKVEEPKQPDTLSFAKIIEGKEDDLYDYFTEKKLLKKMDEMSSADIIKLQLKKQYPKYSEQDIQDVYEERYATPDKPIKDELEDDAIYEAKENKWKEQNERVQRKIAREAQEAKDSLAKTIQEKTLPDIPIQFNSEPQFSQEELDKIAKIQIEYRESLQKGFNNFTKVATTYKDEEVEIPVEVNILPEKKAALKERFEKGFDFLEYMQGRYMSEKGIDGEKLMKEIYILENLQELLSDVANKSASQRHNAQIAEQKNINITGTKVTNVPKQDFDYEKELANKFFSV